MSEKKGREAWPIYRLEPEERLCPEFDAVSIKKFLAPIPGKMGMRVLDDCAEEHQM